MRVVVTGATGNVGTSVLDALRLDTRIDEIVGLARRLPREWSDRYRLVRADVASDDLDPVLHGAHAVIHLAWIVQPARDHARRWRNNVEGTRRVLESAARTGVGTVVYASSVGAYSAAPKNQLVDESWPTNGIAGSEYSREKAAVEGLLDLFESDNPAVRVVRLRPAISTKREAAAGIRKLFIGPLAPSRLFEHVPFVPDCPRLRFQCVHSRDVGDAYRRAVTRDVRGAFNIASDPTLDPHVIAAALDSRSIRVPELVLSAAVRVAFGLHLVRAGPEWLRMALSTPLMDCTRAVNELGWRANVSAVDTLRELMRGLAEDQGLPTPPLVPRHGRMASRQMA